MQPASSEYSVARNYLELLADLPWNKRTDDIIDIAQAKQKLQDDHFGLDHVKKRIIEYLSVIKIKGDLKAPIICFVGPVSCEIYIVDYKSLYKLMRLFILSLAWERPHLENRLLLLLVANFIVSHWVVYVMKLR